jgi:hypothetical protein
MPEPPFEFRVTNDSALRFLQQPPEDQVFYALPCEQIEKEGELIVDALERWKHERLSFQGVDAIPKPIATKNDPFTSVGYAASSVPLYAEY